MQIFLLISTSIALFSCKKKEDPITPTPTNTVVNPGGFNFKLDGGTPITIDSANANLYTSSGKRLMDVYAYSKGIEILEFHFDPTTGSKAAGTTLGSGAFLTYLSSPTQSFDSQSGTLNVTTCDTIGNKLVGDFHFIAKQYPYTSSTTKTITEGHMTLTKISK
jgi:hypothetical protein